MSDWWVSTAGTDTASGTNYSVAKKTLKAMIVAARTGGAQGDTINVVNDGTHILGASASDYVNSWAGTNFTDDWGLRIRGTDSSGDPDLVEIQIPNTNGTYEILRPQVNTNFVLIEGLRFTEASGVDANANVNIQLFEMGSTPGSDMYKFQYCAFEFGNTQASNGNRWVCFSDATRATNVVMESNYFRNVNGFCIGRGGTAVLQLNGVDFNNNVCLNEWPGQSFDVTESVLNSTLTFSMTHNTFANVYQNSVTTLQGMIQAALVDASGADEGTGVVKDNLYVSCVTGDGSNIVSKVDFDNIFANQNAHTFVFSSSDVDYNGWFGQTACIAATSIVPYDNPFSDSSDIPKTNDTTGFATNAASLFNDVTSAYSWIVGAYTIDLDRDLRPAAIAMLSGDSAGSYLGALQGANQPPVAGNVTYSVTAGNELAVNAASGVLSNSSDPDLDTLTCSVVTSPSLGTLDVFNTTTGAFTYTPYDVSEGTDTFTFKVYDGITWSSSASAIITVDKYTVLPPGTETPSISNVVDTAPFFMPDLRVSTQIRFKAKKNRKPYKDLANYTDDELWNESLHRVITLATNTTTQVTLGGVATAQYLQVESDYAIKVSINDASRYWQVNGVVAVALGSATTVYLMNESTTQAVQVILTAVD